MLEKLFSKVKSGLARTRSVMVDGINAVVPMGGWLDDDGIEAIEAILIQADVGLDTTLAVIDELRDRARFERINGSAEIIDMLKGHLVEVVEGGTPLQLSGVLPDSPFVILVVGVNGVGKTTTVGKLAKQYADCGHRVMVAACDTFRAAAIPQLEIWAERAGVEIVSTHQGGDPAAVAFDALAAARARRADVLLVDTAGRLHNKVNLMGELQKIRRALAKQQLHAPHETLLVLDATTGQNALVQAREFHRATELSGFVLTKLDGTAKGGIVVALQREFGVPLKLIGVGEGLEDLRPFDGRQFIQALFDTE